MQLDLWISSPEGSLAKTSAQPAREPESTVRDPACGAKCTGSCLNCDPIGCSLRTSLLCELEALTGCSATWKRSATPAGRSWWVLTTLAPRTSESESGLLPTPKASDGRAKGNGGARKSPGLEQMARAGTLWPTATATEYGSNQGGAAGRVGPKRPSLRTAAMWPTATATDATASGAAGYSTASGRHSGTTLTDATVRASSWTTPSARDWKDTPGMAMQTAERSRLDQLPRQVFAGLPDDSSPSTLGNLRVLRPVLNSSWVATLMGYPSRWAVLTTERASRLWGTASSRKSRKRLGEQS